MADLVHRVACRTARRDQQVGARTYPRRLHVQEAAHDALVLLEVAVDPLQPVPGPIGRRRFKQGFEETPQIAGQCNIGWCIEPHQAVDKSAGGRVGAAEMGVEDDEATRHYGSAGRRVLHVPRVAREVDARIRVEQRPDVTIAYFTLLCQTKMMVAEKRIRD